MRRTNIYLAEDELDALDQLAAQEGRSRAEVIRRLIDAALAGGERDLATDLAAVAASLGGCRPAHLDVERPHDEQRRAGWSSRP